MLAKSVMARMITGATGCVLLSALSCGIAQAAPRPGQPSPAAAPAAWSAPQRIGVAWKDSTAGHPLRRGAYHHARRWAWGGPWGYPAPWLWPDAGAPTVALVVPPAVESAPVDRDSFENLEPRAGIRRGPAPAPALYRLEGPRRNPASRVIRIAGADEGSPQRSRFAHAETGALMLVVPGR